MTPFLWQFGDPGPTGCPISMEGKSASFAHVGLANAKPAQTSHSCRAPLRRFSQRRRGSI